MPSCLMTFACAASLSLSVLAASYDVRVDGRTVPVLDGRVSAYPMCRVWPGHQRALSQTEMAGFARFDFTAPCVVTVAGKGVGSAFVRFLPQKQTADAVRESEDLLRVTVRRTGAFVLMFDGLPDLHLLADPPLPPVPEPGPGGRLIRFAAGEHRPGVVSPNSGDVVVLDEGAVVYGALCILQATNVTVMGRGMFDGSELERADETLRRFHRERGLPEIDTESACFPWSVYGSENVRIAGVTFRDAPFWTLVIRNGCRNTLVDNIHIVGNWRYNSDGLDVCASSDTVVRNSFFRTFDDCLIARGPYLKGETEPVSGLVVTNCDFFCDWGSVVKAQVQDYSGSTIENVRIGDCRFLATSGPAVFLAVRYGADCDVIRDFHMEDIELDFFPQPYQRLQAREDETFEYKPKRDLSLVQATSYTLGRNLDNQRNAPMEDPSYYHFLFENLTFRRFRAYGEDRNLFCQFRALVPNHIIRDVVLEDLPKHEVQTVGNVTFKSSDVVAKPPLASGRISVKCAKQNNLFVSQRCISQKCTHSEVLQLPLRKNKETHYEYEMDGENGRVRGRNGVGGMLADG